MSEFNVGDRVHIEFIADGEVSYASKTLDAAEVRVGDIAYIVPLSTLSKARPALPTKEGSVIRITSWYGATGAAWTALLTVAGWRLSPDRDQLYPSNDIENADADFEVIYVPEN